MSFDLSSIEGLTDEQKATIIAMHEESEKGLKSKNEELLGEVKGYKTKVGESETAAEEARRLAAEKEEARLKAVGDVEGLKKHYEEQLASQTAQIKLEAEKSRNELMSRDKSLIKSQILNNVDPRFKVFAESMLDNTIGIDYQEDGSPKFELKLGDKVFNDAESFLGGAKDNEAWQNVLLDAQSSGSGATQTSGGAADQSNSVQSRLASRLAQKGLTN